MDGIFDSTKARDQAIELICQNLVMAGGIITPEELPDFMLELTGYTDVQLGIALIESKTIINDHLNYQSLN